MKIALFSGTFDPFTLGHKWIIEQGLSIFGEMHVLVGSPAFKKPIFSPAERLQMLQEACPHPRLFTGILQESIVKYAQEIKGGSRAIEIFVIRGVRNKVDLQLEQRIQEITLSEAKNANVDVKTIHFMAPGGISDISSTSVRAKCEIGNWPLVKHQVPPNVYEKLWEYYKKWEVASITEGVKKLRKHRTEQAQRENKSKKYFSLLEKNGFISFTQLVSGDQIRKLLDTVPYDVVCSNSFELKSIDIDAVEPTGHLYLSESLSFGPIIVEKNFLPEFSDLKENIVIEGKHRWFEAKERGEKRVEAWVGNRASL